MNWPTPQDYQEAIQNPALAFNDSELRSGQAEAGLFGLPKPRSGNFATVYKMVCGSRTWAVRCFNRDFRDQQTRYAAISTELTRLCLPYTVAFQFLADGIRTRNIWYPILKMEWIDGESLTTFVEKHLGSQKLNELADTFLELSAHLRDVGIAHGDLQHGNVLVSSRGLRLIDYDGMYVPQLAGMKSHECGHANYQHPKRSEVDFGPTIDNFSVWSICLSLRALAVDGSLWARYKGGDECLLLRRADYLDPEHSAIIRDLCLCRDQTVRAMAATFRTSLSLPPLEVPTLDKGTSVRSPFVREAVPEWLREHVPKATDSSTSVADLLPHQSQDVSWLIKEAINSENVPAFQNDVFVDRFAVATCLVISALASYEFLVERLSSTIVSSIVTILMSGLSAFLRYRFLTDNETRRIAALRQECGAISEKAADAWREVECRNAELFRQRSVFDKRECALRESLTQLDSKTTLQLFILQQKLSTGRMRHASARRDLQKTSNDSIRRVLSDGAASLAEIDRQIADLSKGEEKESEALLKQRQHQHITLKLREAYIRDAPISRQLLYRGLRETLTRSGFRTAADISPSVGNVPQIGKERLRALMGWRASVEAAAKKTMPRALEHSDQQSLRRKYESSRKTLMSRKQAVEINLASEERRLLVDLQNSITRINDEERSQEVIIYGEIAKLQANSSHESRLIEEQLKTLSLERQKAVALQDARRAVTEAEKRHNDLVWRRSVTSNQIELATQVISMSQYIRRVAWM